MSKQVLIDLLDRKGVCTTSDLVQAYGDKFRNKSVDAIRKLISRTEGINTLKLIRLPHNQSLIYTKNNFCSNFFWSTLLRKLYENSSVYYDVLRMFEYFGGVLLINEFCIFSGVSNKQKKNITNGQMINNLISSKLLRKEYSDEVGEYFILNKNNDYKFESLSLTSNRLNLERFIYSYVSEWMRRICFVSYNKIKTKINSKENPLVGNVEWCLSAPSYIDSMRMDSSSGVKPGFVVADILIQDFFVENQNNSMLDDVGYFISKKEKLKNSNKNQNFMFFIFARSFTKDALFNLRRCGAIPVTFSNMFGLSFSKEIIEYSSLIKKKTEIIKRKDKVIEMKKSFDSVYGDLGRFSGFIFELFVGSFVSTHLGPGYVKYNVVKNIVVKDKKNGSEKKVFAETDVMYFANDRLYCIECKNVKNLSDEEVSRWIDNRIPIFNKALKNEGNTMKIHHYLWVTGDISDKSKDLIMDLSRKNKKIEIKFLCSKELYDYIELHSREYAKLYCDYGFLHRKKKNVDSAPFVDFLDLFGDDNEDYDSIFSV